MRYKHFSVGAIIQRNNKILLIDRKNFPYGFACIAGHIEKETPEHALKREVKEESGLFVTQYKKLLEQEIPWNKCNKGVKGHYWHVFSCGVKGNVKKFAREEKSIGLYSKAEIKKLRLESVWRYFFKKLGIIPKR